MKTKNPLSLALEDVLGPAGFTRKGDSWFRRTEEIVEVLNLQKSQWGRQYYLNYALWLRALGEAPFPRHEQCHVQMRASAFLPPDDLARLLNLESDLTDAERRAALAGLLTSGFLPFASTCRTVSGLRSLLGTGKLKQLLVLAVANPILE